MIIKVQTLQHQLLQTYLQILTNTLDIPARSIDILRTIILYIGVDANINDKLTRKALMHHTYVNKSNLTMYLKTLTDAGVLESINSTLRFNKKYLPSVVGNSIELTIVIDAN